MRFINTLYNLNWIYRYFQLLKKIVLPKVSLQKVEKWYEFQLGKTYEKEYESQDESSGCGVFFFFSFLTCPSVLRASDPKQ